jgi:hypothetical protein
MQRATQQTRAEATTTQVDRGTNPPLRTQAVSKLPFINYSGNQTALRRLTRTSPHVQCKLTIGAVDDPLEAEADRVADHVMRMPDPDAKLSSAAPQLSRKCGACEEEDKKLNAQPDGTLAQGDAPPIVHDVLNSSGQSLDSATCAFMEPRFGYDFSRVRVHSDAAAQQSARDVNANAYTVQNNIVFAAGQLAPGTRRGQQLMAHELAHVVQQNGAPAVIQRGPHDPPPPSRPAADRAAYERYLETLRETMAKPAVANPELAEIVEKLYRDHPEIGSGSTAAAIRNELATGMATKGTRHLTAGHERMNMLAKWFENQKELAKAIAKKARKLPPGTLASARDVATAEHLFKDLQQSVDSGYYADFEITFHPPAGGPAGGTDPAPPTDPAAAPATDPGTAPATAPATPEPAGTTPPVGVAPAVEEIGEAAWVSVFRSASKFLAKEGPGLVLQLVAMALFPPKVHIHSDNAAELSRTKLEPAVQAALEKQKGVFKKMLDEDWSQSIYANVTATLSYRVEGSPSGAGDLELYLVDVAFVDMQIAHEDDHGADAKFDISARPITRHVTQALLLFEPESVTRDREWAQAQQKYQDCVRQYGTGHVPPAAGVDGDQPNPEEGPCIPPHMKPMEGP